MITDAKLPFPLREESAIAHNRTSAGTIGVALVAAPVGIDRIEAGHSLRRTS